MKTSDEHTREYGPEDGKIGGGTPFARWRFDGLPNPFEEYLNERRENLCCGKLTDFELANEVFLDPNIVNITGAKERIRWLSSRLLDATEKIVTMRNTIVLVQGDDYEHRGHGGGRWYRTWELWINGELFSNLREHSQDTGWGTGRYMDDWLVLYLEPLERCLQTRTVRGQRCNRLSHPTTHKANRKTTT